MNEKTKFKLVFALLAFALAHFYPNICEFFAHKYKNDSVNQHDHSSSTSSNMDSDTLIKRQIIGSWKNLIATPNQKLKIAIGLNTNVDLILPAIELFDKLNHHSSLMPYNAYNHHILHGIDALMSCFKYFFMKGSAAERTFLDKSDFMKVLNAGIQLKQKQWFIGGNAALMAKGLSKRAQNSEIYLFGPVGPRLKEMLIETGLNESSSQIRIHQTSQIESDEIHLILEYSEHDVFDDIRPPRPNRFIVTHDYYNSRMELIEEFFDFVKTYEPHLIILSGLHLLESQNNLFRQQKLLEINRLLGESNKGMIHLELASIGDELLLKQVIENNLLQNINSLGLNEQELLFLSHISESAPHSSYFNEFEGTFPDLNKSIDIMEWILAEFGKPGQHADSKLSRIHFHCLNYHIIAEAANENHNTKSSLLSGAKIASKQACGIEFDDESNDEKLEKMLELKWLSLTQHNSVWLQINKETAMEFKFNAINPVIEFVRPQYDIRFSMTPILMCRNPVKTVGLGDAISASGLFYYFA